MKHTIIINQKSAIEHVIYLDNYLPLTIKKLPTNMAYKIHNTPIYTTTTRTLNKLTIQKIRQKNKNITTPVHLIIIKNTPYIPRIQIQTIKENPQISIHPSTQENLHKTLKKLLRKHTPKTHEKVTIKKHTLYHDNKPIKTYKNNKYLQLIHQNLQKHPNHTLQHAEYHAQQKYYQYITYDKHNKNYKLTINNKTISTHRKLSHAIQEKQIRQKNTEKEEETLCQKNTRIPEQLPPTPWNNTLHYTIKEHNIYRTRHDTRHNNPDTTTYIKQKNTPRQTILNMQKPDRNIRKEYKTYLIIKTTNKKKMIYYKTDDQTKARYIRDKLEQNHYNTKKIPLYEKQYPYNKKIYQKKYQQQYNAIDYYQKTTTKLTQKPDAKERYQKQQIQKTTSMPRNGRHQQAGNRITVKQ